jgi:deaminated glutathione amidase
MANSIPAAVVQLCSRQNVAENVKKTVSFSERAAAAGAKVIVLPENFPYIGSLSQKVKQAETLGRGPVQNEMVALAQRLRAYVILGGIPIRSEDPGRCFNTCIVLNPDGEIAGSYRKIHLFDIAIPDGPNFTESEFISPGEETAICEIDGRPWGLTICYDLRFPEMYRHLVANGVQACCVPAAFTLQTGKDHWLALLRARAIENQFYVLAAGQWGAHTQTRTSFGNSCIIDPWGTVVAKAKEGEGFALADIDFDYLSQVRQMLPALKHRRL